MLTALLKSIGDEYTVEFRNDIKNSALIVRVTRDKIYQRESEIPFLWLSDELCVVRVIRETVELVENDWRNGAYYV